jgi:REP element-mobilizing transposase RayT
MRFNPDIHHRKSIRLRDYDYSANGAYFVTVCVQRREGLFGNIVDDAMDLTDAGRMVEGWWTKLPEKFSGVHLDEFTIMPNHFHGIIIVGATPCGCPDVGRPHGADEPEPGRPHGADEPEPGRPHGAAPTVGDVMDWFKTMTTNAYIRGVRQTNWPPYPGRLWQRNYYERIIRNEDELTAIREYIRQNPMKWTDDEDNPANAR